MPRLSDDDDDYDDCLSVNNKKNNNNNNDIAMINRQKTVLSSISDAPYIRLPMTVHSVPYSCVYVPMTNSGSNSCTTPNASSKSLSKLDGNNYQKKTGNHALAKEIGRKPLNEFTNNCESSLAEDAINRDHRLPPKEHRRTSGDVFPLERSQTAAGRSQVRRSSSLSQSSLSHWEGEEEEEHGAPPRARRRRDRCSCQRVRINVSGYYFEARASLLNRHPDTLLGDPRRRQRYYDRNKDELFLDRHRPSFEAIFSYYQYGGKLKRPHHVPDDIFLSELQFYELERDVVDEYKRQEGYTTEEIVLPANDLLCRLWVLFEYPETSRAAFLVAVVSVVMTLVSIVLFCIETLPVFSLSHCVTDEAPNFLDPFFVIETTCTTWFTLEVIIRFVASPDKLRFWRDFKNVVDVTAVVPYYVTLVNVLSTMSCSSAKSSASLAFLRVIRLVRVFKLTKHSVGLQVLILTFKASVEGLGLFLVALVVCLLVYSSAIYYAELGVAGSQISSIPDAFWWAIITMTTVGYGDKVPVGVWGKLIGAACAITGVLTLAIPVPIITGHFNRFYSRRTGRGRHV